MFRKIALAAAFALAASMGIAHAEGEGSTDGENLQSLRSGTPAGPTMSGTGARALVRAGEERLIIIYGGAATRSLQTGGTARITTDGDGTYHTVYAG
jgi:hypothetical protein